MSTLKQITHITLASLLLVATTGITLNKHYCMGRLKSVSVFHLAKGNCCNENSEQKMPCCKDVSQQMKIEEIATSSFDFDSTPSLFVLTAFTFFEFEPHENKNIKNVFKEYSPPPPDSNITILIQAFLI